MGYNEYLEQIKNSPLRKLYFLYGEEKHLTDNLTGEISRKVPAAEKQILFGGETDMETFVRSLFEKDLFSGAKLYVLKAADEIKWEENFKKPFIRWLSEENSGNTVVLTGKNKKNVPADLWKSIQQHGMVCELKRLYERDLIPFIRNLAQKNNRRITDTAVNRFIELCGTDLTEITSQWEKILLYAEDDPEITADIVSEVVGLTSHFNVFQLIDNMMAGNFGKALEIIRSILESGTHPLQPMALIIKHFGQLEQLLLAGNDSERFNEIKRSLKLLDFQFNKIRNQLHRLTLAKTERILDILAETDREIKSRASSVKHSNLIFEKGMIKIFTVLRS